MNMDLRNVDKRDSILKLQLDERENEFTTLQNFKIFVGTYFLTRSPAFLFQ